VKLNISCAFIELLCAEKNTRGAAPGQWKITLFGSLPSRVKSEELRCEANKLSHRVRRAEADP